ncbi:MAG: ABC transporter permease [Bacteriovoracia bacterium]
MKQRNSAIELGWSLISAALWLLLWEFGLAFMGADQRFFPPPSQILPALFHLLFGPQPAIALALADSGTRFLGGLALAIPAAFLLSLLTVYSKICRRIFSPLFATLYSVPRAAIHPLLLTIMGIGALSQTFLIFVGIFFFLYLALENSLQKIANGQLYELSTVFRVPFGKRLYYFVFKPVLPDFFAGLKLAAGYGLSMVVLGEAMAANSGIGFYIYSCWERFAIVELFAGLLALGIIGWIINALCEFGRKKTQWPL